MRTCCCTSVDASDPLRDERIVQVREVLAGIGAGEHPRADRCSTRSI